MPKIPQQTTQPTVQTRLTTFWVSVGDEVKLYLGDVIDLLWRMPARSVHCVVTSPPYWGLRAYLDDEHDSKSKEIGSEETPQEFVAKMVEFGRAVRHVLRDDGTFFLNLGDTYSQGNKGAACGTDEKNEARRFGVRPNENGGSELPAGNLVGIPWRSALALQEDGWILRSDMPWVKRSAMPESCDNRPGKSLEYVFMLTKTDDYYFDMQAIRSTRGFRNSDLWFASVDEPHGAVGVGDEIVGLDVTSRGYKGAHFAVFPPTLIQPMILAGTSEYGCCAACEKPYERVNTKSGAVTVEKETKMDRSLPSQRNGLPGSGSTLAGTPSTTTIGWQQRCGCRNAGVKPCVVMDPFTGSGTTCATAVSLGRHGVGTDLSETYLRENAIPRIEAAIAGVVKKANVSAVVVRPVPISARAVKIDKRM